MHLHVTNSSWSIKIQNPEQFTARSESLSDALTEIIQEAASEPTLGDAMDRMILALYRHIIEVTNDDILGLKHSLEVPDEPFCEATLADVMETALHKLNIPINQTAQRNVST